MQNMQSTKGPIMLCNFLTTTCNATLKNVFVTSFLIRWGITPCNASEQLVKLANGMLGSWLVGFTKKYTQCWGKNCIAKLLEGTTCATVVASCYYCCETLNWILLHAKLHPTRKQKCWSCRGTLLYTVAQFFCNFQHGTVLEAAGKVLSVDQCNLSSWKVIKSSHISKQNTVMTTED